MEHEANFIELLDNYDEFFGSKIEHPKVAEYYSEIYLKIPAFYLMLDRLKVIDDTWDRI